MFGSRQRRAIEFSRLEYYADAIHSATVKEELYRSWCGVNRVGDSGVHIHSAILVA